MVFRVFKKIGYDKCDCENITIFINKSAALSNFETVYCTSRICIYIYVSLYSNALIYS